MSPTYSTPQTPPCSGCCWVRPFPTHSTNPATRPCPADRVLPHPRETQNASLSGQHPCPMGCWVRPSLCGQPSVTERPCSTSAPFHASANMAGARLHFLLPVVYRPVIPDGTTPAQRSSGAPRARCWDPSQCRAWRVLTVLCSGHSRHTRSRSLRRWSLAAFFHSRSRRFGAVPDWGHSGERESPSETLRGS